MPQRLMSSQSQRPETPSQGVHRAKSFWGLGGDSAHAFASILGAAWLAADHSTLCPTLRPSVQSPSLLLEPGDDLISKSPAQ